MLTTGETVEEQEEQEDQEDLLREATHIHTRQEDGNEHAYHTNTMHIHAYIQPYKRQDNECKGSE